MTDQRLVRVSAGALAVGGVLVALLNLVLTPMLPAGGGTVTAATSTAFEIRMPLAAAGVALVTLGLVGLYLVQASRLRLGGLAFLVAWLGGMMTFFDEVVQITLVRDLALAAPETLESLEEAGALVRYDVVFAVGFGIFMLGWLAVAVVTLRAGVVPRRGPWTLIIGMLLAPLLGAIGPGLWGAAAGSAVVAAGWALMGFDARRVALDSSGPG